MRDIQIKRYRSGIWEKSEDVVAEEALLEIFADDQRLGAFVCTPSQIREMVYGYLACIGLICEAQEVLDYREEWGFSRGVPARRAWVKLRIARSLHIPPIAEILRSACGDFERVALDVTRLTPRPLFSSSRLLSLPQRVLVLSEGFKKTGAFHSAALFDRDLDLMFYAEDISRHNAVDKAIGAAVLSGESLSESLLYTTGRVGAEVTLKALRVDIPVVVSPSAPLWGAVALARQYELGLVGFLRGRRFNLYSGAGWFIS